MSIAKVIDTHSRKLEWSLMIASSAVMVLLAYLFLSAIVERNVDRLLESTRWFCIIGVAYAPLMMSMFKWRADPRRLVVVYIYVCVISSVLFLGTMSYSLHEWCDDVFFFWVDLFVSMSKDCTLSYSSTECAEMGYLYLVLSGLLTLAVFGTPASLGLGLLKRLVDDITNE